MSRAARFPRELTASPLRHPDWMLLGIVGLMILLTVPPVLVLREAEPPEVSLREREAYLRVIYRAQPAPEVAPEPVPLEAEAEAPAVSARAPGQRETVREARQRRAREALARAQAREARMERVRSTGVFTAAGARMPAFDAGDAGAALSLEGGSLEGLVARNLEQIATRPDAAEVEQLRREGLIREPAAEVDPLESRLAEVDVELAEAAVSMEGLPEVRGGVGGGEARGEQVLRTAIRAELPGLRACYAAQRRRDATLRGELEVRLTVAPDGEVARVLLRRSRWSNPALGVRVERCLEQRIARWRFAPADGGAVTLSFPLVFGE